MPRKPRIKSSTQIYHVVIKGINSQLLFEENYDYQRYLDILNLYKSKFSLKIFAYTLMSNHVHILLYIPNNNIDNVFRSINTSYAIWFNMKYKRTGPLQQDRYYSEPVLNNKQFLLTLRYIHLNPYNANIEKAVGQSYIWSSFNDYVNNISTLVDTSFLMNLINNQKNLMILHQPNSKYDAIEYLDIHNVRKRLPDDVAQQLIVKHCNCYTATEFQALEISKRNAYISLLHKKGISIRQLNRLTGIPKGIIERSIANK